MKKILLIILLTILTISVYCQSSPFQNAAEKYYNDLIKDMVQKASLSLEDISLEPSHARDGGKGAYKLFYSLWDNWHNIPFMGNYFATSAFEQPKTIHGAFYLCPYADVNIITDAVTLKEPYKKIEEKDAFEKTIKDINGVYIKGSKDQIPEDIKEALAVIIIGSQEALKYHEEAFTDKKYVYDNLFTCLENLGDYVDRDNLLEGALILSEFTDKAIKNIEKSNKKYYVKIQTDLGTIEVSEGQDNNYTDSNSFICIDLSGNDRYGAGYGGTNNKKPISVLIDKEGDDRYETSQPCSFGAGIMGYGILVDMKGNDLYLANSFSLGAGYCGFGALIDYEGEDHYTGYECVEGSSNNGLGYLHDFDGNDGYYCMAFGQGFGGPGGLGVLADNKGNDSYIADDINLVNPSPQTAEHNTSMSQGAGFGHRNGQIAGGIGILTDKEGDDVYNCGVFGQGVSYWYSFGALVDFEGDDIYNAVWYCYGAAAHYSVGCFMDKAGNDSYTCNNAFGLGHDYSIGFFEDSKGNDKYKSVNTPIGWVNANGLSLFFDLEGDDDYSEVRISEATNSWSHHKCYAIFLDRGGKNIMPKTENDLFKDKFWVVKENSDNPKALAIGMLK